MKKSQKGFTLVELIVVIAIIGVLAAILVPAMVGYIKDSKFTSANANAKTIYNAAMAFAQKCETAGKKIAADEDVFTADLEVDSTDTTSAKVGNISAGAVAGTNTLATGAEAEIKHAVNASLGEEADETHYCISFNAKGFPKAVYWAKTSDDTVVGKYPAPEDNLESTGGITDIVASGDSAFGNE